MAIKTKPAKVKLTEDSVYGEAEFSLGIVRDMPRSSIPVGGVYDAVDMLVDRPGVIYKRGGTTYQGVATGAFATGVGFVVAPEFQSGAKVLALGADNHVWDLTADVDAGALGITTIDNPHLYIDRVIVASSDGITAPMKISAPSGVTTVAAWGGSPPVGRLATVHLSRVILANSAAQPSRIWFSTLPDPETAWDTDNAYADTNHFITGIVPCQGVLVVFSAGHTERIVGDIPPGTVGENMSVQPVGEVGCVDSRSIAPWRGNVIFAGQGGIWVTNGVGFDSLIEKDNGSGIASYWREIYDVTAANGGIFAGGVYARDYYVISLSYGTTLVDTLCCYMPRKAWTRMSNIACRSFANAFTGANELYGATISGAPGDRVIKFSPVFNPAAANKNDADGDPVQPVAQLRMIGEGVGQKAYGHGHVTYDLRDAAADDPTVAITSSSGIESDSGFTAVAEGTPLVETTRVTRKRFIVNRDAQVMNLKFAQTGASAQTEVYAVEQEVRPYNVTADG